MNFKNIPVTCQPAYTWLWNSSATKDEIKRQIDEMYQNGIRAFYVLGEPESFRPNLRRTYLKPDYLSEEYLDMVYFAYEYAKEKGMYTWLYNEGGFPSGMACGKIRDAHPELALKNIAKNVVNLSAGERYCTPERFIAAFCDNKRIKDGDAFESDTVIEEYIYADAITPTTSMRTDIAERKNTEYFLELTHEAFKRRFGDAMGSDVTMMFDDEANMGSWTRNMDKLFFDKYGYDLLDYVPYIAGKPTDSLESARAYSDFIMLSGELMRNNYFAPMRKWLNDHNMLSIGHLGGDNYAKSPYLTRQGNLISALRLYDVPGIDVIWSQITYPTDGKCCKDGNEFFPLYASSAARQQGNTKCVSESFAVYGAHVVPEEMRFCVNYQAVQGISLFNFMVISFDRKDARSLQYRPNFIAENPGMDCLGQINNYTARLSHIMQNATAQVKTALYFPQRTISSKSEWGKNAEEAFDDKGHMLMKKGVCFDIIDEEFVLGAKVENGCLIGEHVTYENVFIVDGIFEPQEVIKKLEACNADIIPCFERTKDSTLARKLLFADGSEGYFICNTCGEKVNETITLTSDKTPYVIDLESGDIMTCAHEKRGGELIITAELLRGQGLMLWLTTTPQNANLPVKTELAAEISDFNSYISRKYEINPTYGVVNTYFDSGENLPIGEWDRDFSGEVTYTAKLPEIGEGEFLLDMGEVRHYAKIYINGIKMCEATMPPYVVSIQAKSGDELKIVVANTPANVTHNAEFFELQDIRDVGPYHKKMKLKEALAPAGGLMNSVKIYRKM